MNFYYVVAGQESWEKEGNVIAVDGYTWFGKPRSDQKSQRGEGGGWGCLSSSRVLGK